MTRDVYERETIITAKRGMFLALANVELNDSINTIGKPERIIFSNSAEVPNFVEVEL